MRLPDLPDGWRVWNEEPNGRAIVAFRPDIFTEEEFPAACLPTIYLTNGSRNSRPGAGQYQTDEWHIVLFLEPEVEVTAHTYDERDAAVDALVTLAGEFVDGAVDYREAYQVPREAYLAELDRLTGGSDR